MRVAHPEICNPHYKMYSVNEASKCLVEHVTVVGCNRSGCRLRRNAVNLYGRAFLSRGIGFQSSGSDSEIAANLYAARFACFARGGVGIYAARNGYTDIRITAVLVYQGCRRWQCLLFRRRYRLLRLFRRLWSSNCRIAAILHRTSLKKCLSCRRL